MRQNLCTVSRPHVPGVGSGTATATSQPLAPGDDALHLAEIRARRVSAPAPRARKTPCFPSPEARASSQTPIFAGVFLPWGWLGKKQISGLLFHPYVPCLTKNVRLTPAPELTKEGCSLRLGGSRPLSRLGHRVLANIGSLDPIKTALTLAAPLAITGALPRSRRAPVPLALPTNAATARRAMG